MLYLIGVDHSWQHDLNPSSKEQREKYLNFLKNTILEKNIVQIFEEWTNGANPEFTNSYKLVQDLKSYQSNIKYYQIDPQEKERPYSRKETNESIEKLKDVNNWREKRWIDLIKNEYREVNNAIVIVGNGHITNNFSLSEDNKIFCLDNPLLKKLRDEKIKFEVLFSQ